MHLRQGVSTRLAIEISVHILKLPWMSCGFGLETPKERTKVSLILFSLAHHGQTAGRNTFAKSERRRTENGRIHGKRTRLHRMVVPGPSALNGAAARHGIRWIMC